MDVKEFLRKIEPFVDMKSIKELEESESFSLAIDQCVANSYADYETQFNKITNNKKSFDEQVLRQNNTGLTIFAGVISELTMFLSIFDFLSDENYKNQALLKIYKKMVAITQEIYCLSLSGFPDGAIARWRSLFESHILILYLLKNDEELSKRFLRHEIVARKKIHDNFRQAKVTNDQFEDDNDYKSCIEDYGPEFKENYGWLSYIVKNHRNRNFAYICRKVGNLDQYAFYKLSSEILHANSYSTLVYMGHKDDMVPIGPSIHGNLHAQILTFTTVLFTAGYLNENFVKEIAIRTFISTYIVRLLETINSDILGV